MDFSWVRIRVYVSILRNRKKDTNDSVTYFNESDDYFDLQIVL